MINIKIDECEFCLKETHDFKWLSDIGKVENVFDENDSGNISFGVRTNDKKYFVKYAGAKPMNYEGETAVAIDNLRAAIRVYQAIKHPSLIVFVKAIQCEKGVAAIFEWSEGECLFAHWTFDQWNRYTCEQSAYNRFHHLAVEKRLKAIETIFDFLMLVERLNYVAVDLYDGSILYDFKQERTMICDIDFYQKKPIINMLGEDYWGSSRVKAPEENELNATIDSISNVYTMGKLIGCLLADERNLSLATWCHKQASWAIVEKATQKERNLRYQSVLEFWKAWEKAI